MATRILIADDELNIRKVLAATLRREGYEVLTAKDGAEAVEIFREKQADIRLVISDRRDQPCKVTGRTRAESTNSHE